ncbi:MAG: superfamily II helicase [Satyrvirus sp.]|uniref:Superfamily II helicase n=1 Tax=Satyrvirus sp. TaxID=2487771 RepID=A0A3G5ADU5_9VIRU|nr:MAG: superfamily II helicase [Satyrvirus sp.]
MNQLINYLKKLNTFDDIYSITAKLTKKEKGDLFEIFTYYLFKFDPRLNSNLQDIWLYKDVPNKILTDLDLPTKDKGIDLLAKINDDYYAIQCKFRQDQNKIISWNELSTFFGLSFGINNKIKGGFLVTNTYDLADEVIKSTKVEPIYGNFFDDLPKKNFFKSINENKIEYERKRPFKYQTMCKINCEFHYLDFSRAHIEMACGTGKTLTSYWVDKTTFNKRTVIFVPSLYLLSQFYSDWVNQSYAENVKIDYLLVGSDADVDEDTKYKSNGLILYTDTNSIKKYINQIKNKLVVICTYQSSDKLAACKTSFDFGIYDEAHKTVGRINKKFSLALTNKNIMIGKRLFMTATPKMYNGALDDEEVISMDNRKIYGDKIFTYNTGEAIKDKRLVDYQVLSICARNSDIKKDIRKNKLVKYLDEFEDEEANYLGTIIIILKKIHDGTCKHLITYHNKIKRAKKFKEFLVKVNELLYDEEIFVENLDGKMTMGKRNKIIKEFTASKKGILCTAKVLNEGVNIPIVDSICFVDPRFSTIDIIQCIGRSLRLYPGKELAHIIVPIFIDNFNDEFDKDVYGNVIRILKSLKSTDNGIVEYFKLKADGGVIGRKICKMEYYNNAIDISKEIDIGEWNNKLEVNLWQVVDSFEYMYEKVKKWVDDNGELPKNKPDNIDEQKLNSWCCNQKQNKKNNKLNEKKIRKLNEIKGWCWIDETIERDIKSFDEIYEELKRWFVENNKMPSCMSNDNTEKKLGVWCVTQRQKNKNNKLDKDKIKNLEKIKGWIWSFDDIWNDNYTKLTIWIEKNNKFPSQKSVNVIESKLAKWCYGQKYMKNRSKLDEYKISNLEKINGWTWSNEIIRKNKSFDENYNELVLWIKNHDKIPLSHTKDNFEKRLAKWCHRQREHKKHNKLTAEQILQMEKISGWFWDINKIISLNFDENLDKVNIWVNNNNKIPSNGSTNSEERYLGNWCAKQRRDKKLNKLNNNQLKKLEKIKGWFWLGNDRKLFDDMYNEIKKWIMINKRLPTRNPTDEKEKRFNFWCAIQRGKQQKNKLNSDQIKQLENLDGWFWSNKNNKVENVLKSKN